MSVVDAVQRVRQIELLLLRGPSTAAAPAPDAPATAAATAPGGFAPILARASAAGTPAGDDGGFGPEIAAAATRHGIPPEVLRALVRQESGFDPAARSPAGAVGLTQLMPATAAGLGVTNPLDPAQALEGGARYLRQQLDRFGGDLPRALAAYNAGPGAVERFGGVPPYPETQRYVAAILGAVGGAAPAPASGALPYRTT